MMYQQTDFLSALFLPNESTVTGQHTASGFLEQAIGPIGHLNPSNPALQNEYVCLNPVIGKKLDANVQAYRSWLIEFDDLDLDKQLQLLAALEKLIPIRSIAYSGNKSYHAIITLSDDLGYPVGPQGIEGYKMAFKRLMDAVEAVLNCPGAIDRANSNCSRYTRLGGSVNNKTHKQQSVFKLGGLTTSEQLMAFIHDFSPAVTTSLDPLTPKSAVYRESFDRTINSWSHLKGLKQKIQVPKAWAAASGNRLHVFNTTLWAIDATGVQQSELTSYFHKHITPALITAGYDNAAQKVEDAIRGAYNWKKIK